MYNVVFVGVLSQEKHPKLPEIKAKQDEVNAAWDRLWDLALKRRESLSNAADLQRFKRYGAENTAQCLEGCPCTAETLALIPIPTQSRVQRQRDYNPS